MTMLIMLIRMIRMIFNTLIKMHLMRLFINGGGYYVDNNDGGE